MNEVKKIGEFAVDSKGTGRKIIDITYLPNGEPYEYVLHGLDQPVRITDTHQRIKSVDNRYTKTYGDEVHYGLPSSAEKILRSIEYSTKSGAVAESRQRPIEEMANSEISQRYINFLSSLESFGNKAVSGEEDDE